MACPPTHSSHYLSVSVPTLIAATAEVKEVSAHTQTGGRRRESGQRMRVCRSQKVREVNTVGAKWKDYISPLCNMEGQNGRRGEEKT